MNKLPIHAVAVVVFGTMFATTAKANEIEEQLPETHLEPAFYYNTGLSTELTDGEYGKGTGASLSGTAYLEGVYNGYYLGVMATLTDQTFDNEVDLFFGFRKDLSSGLSYDIGYRRYIYSSDVFVDYGEIIASFYAPIGDKVTTSISFAYDPENELGNVYVNGAFSVTDTLALSADYGVYEVSYDDAQSEWGFGGTYYINDTVSLDLRWWEGTEYDGYAAFTVSFDTSSLAP